MSTVLIDTDVIIDYLRDNEQAALYLENLEGKLLISSITVAELFSGIKNNKEKKTLEELLSLFECISADAEIAKLAGHFRRQYGKSHGTGIADALIAATATICEANMITLNIKHFPMFPSLAPPYVKHSATG